MIPSCIHGLYLSSGAAAFGSSSYLTFCGGRIFAGRRRGVAEDWHIQRSLSRWNNSRSAVCRQVAPCELVRSVLARGLCERGREIFGISATYWMINFPLLAWKSSARIAIDHNGNCKKSFLGRRYGSDINNRCRPMNIHSVMHRSTASCIMILHHTCRTSVVLEAWQTWTFCACNRIVGTCPLIHPNYYNPV